MQDDTGREIGPSVCPDTAPILPRLPEDPQAWLDALNALDEDPPPPSAYPLTTDEGRRGFLEAYIWRGEAALFESVMHIWNSLSPPKAYRCLLVGAAAGTGGSGKDALVPFLRKALREALDDGLIQPTGEGCADIHEYHKVSMDFFAASYNHYEKTIQKYADLLNGGPPDVSPKATVIEGPWKSSVDDPQILGHPPTT